MKRYIFALMAIILITGSAFISLSNEKTKTIKTDGILSVNDISSDPSAYKGAITITGVVADKSRFKAPANVFLMVETSEAKICKQTGCARFYLPVKFEGMMPKEWDEVNVTGSFTEGSGPLFVATKVEVLRHLTLK